MALLPAAVPQMLWHVRPSTLTPPHAEMRIYGGGLPVSWALQVRTGQQDGTSAASRALGQQQQRGTACSSQRSAYAQEFAT